MNLFRLKNSSSTNHKFTQRAFLLIPLALGCFGLSPAARAVSPAPDGGYPGFNTAEGEFSLQSLTSGSQNTAIGFGALFNNTSGNNNTSIGVNSLNQNKAGGDNNTATGNSALQSNTTGTNNTATGNVALISNMTGSFNTATGGGALFSNTTGSFNTAAGQGALHNNSSGTRNTATGWQALFSNTGPSGSGLNGDDNTATGWQALINNTTGHDNTAVGLAALGENTTGFLNTALGSVAGSVTTGNNNIDIGNQGVAAESNTIRIGTQVDTTDIFGFILPKHTATYIAGITGVTIATNNAPVAINTTTGQLGLQPVASSQRFKDEIKPMDKAREAILALKPVTFHYKKEIDPKATTQFGLVAEEVEKVNPALITRDRDGKPYTVRYEAVNAMLLNEFLKAHRKVQAQQATISQLNSRLAKQEAIAAHLQKEIQALTAGLQKVSAQLEVTKPAPQMVDSHQ